MRKMLSARRSALTFCVLCWAVRRAAPPCLSQMLHTPCIVLFSCCLLVFPSDRRRSRSKALPTTTSLAPGSATRRVSLAYTSLFAWCGWKHPTSTGHLVSACAAQLPAGLVAACLPSAHPPTHPPARPPSPFPLQCNRRRRQRRRCGAIPLSSPFGGRCRTCQGCSGRSRGSRAAGCQESQDSSGLRQFRCLVAPC